MRTGRIAALCAGVAAVVALTGCGAVLEGGGGTAPDGTELPTMKALWSQMREATLAADSGHITGFVTDENQALSLDVEGNREGTNQRVRIEQPDGAAVILTVGRTTYIRGNWDFWNSTTGDQKAANALKGKYVRVPPAESEDFDDYSFGGLVDELLAEEELGLQDTVGGSVVLRTHADREVLVASDLRGNEFWVDRETGLLVRFVATDDEPGELNFDRWGAARSFKAPATSKTISLG